MVSWVVEEKKSIVAEMVSLMEKVKADVIAKTPRVKVAFGAIKNEMVTYRIKPHANVTNNNKRLWLAIHHLYEIYQPLTTRREKWYSTQYREKDYFWYDVIFGRRTDRRK
jgi:hypothetical protein